MASSDYPFMVLEQRVKPSGKLVEKEYAGYLKPTTTRALAAGRILGTPAVRTRGGRLQGGVPTRHVRPRVENRHGFAVGICVYSCIACVLMRMQDSNILHNLKANEMSVLVKLMNHESMEVAAHAYEIIKGLSINEFTGAISAAPNAIKNLGILMGSHVDEVLVGCITILHSLVQQDEDLTMEIYIVCIDKLTSLLQTAAADVLCGAISLLGLMAAVDDILCDMIDKDLHELLADRYHSTNDVVVKRQIFLALHHFMLIKNSEKAMHTKVITILVETLQMSDDVIDPDIRISALRILSYISMSGSEYLQKMIGDLGGIPTLARLVRMADRRNATIKELTKTAGMALSSLCCVLSLQEQVLAEWGLDSMLFFLDVNSNDPGPTLAIIMAFNNLLENSSIKPALCGSTYLKHLVRSVQQKANNEDILEECTETLRHLLPNDLKQSQQTKFEKLCMQHFSPLVPVMLRKKTNLHLPSESPVQRGSHTRNWLLSPDHSSFSPRRLLFPRKLNLLFSPKRSSPSQSNSSLSSASANSRRHSISLDSPHYKTSPFRIPRRKSIPSYSATPSKLHRKQRSPLGQTSLTRQGHSHSPHNTSTEKPLNLSVISPYKFQPPCDSSELFCSPLQTPTWDNAPSPLPPRPQHPSPTRFSAHHPSRQSPTNPQILGTKTRS